MITTAVDKSIRQGHAIQDYLEHTPSIQQADLADLVSRYDYFIFDCDGVLFHSGHEIGEAFKALSYIKSFPGKKIFFLTNALSRTRQVFLDSKIIGEHGFHQIPL